MNEVMNTTAYFPNRLNRAKVALGNSEARYNSQVEGSRKKYFINSTLFLYNSEGIAKKYHNG